MQLFSRWATVFTYFILFHETVTAFPHASTIETRDVLNTTVLNATIPSTFFIRASEPGATIGPSPSTAKTQVLLRTIEALRTLALADYNQPLTQHESYVFPYFSISFDGPTPGAPMVAHRYALWGLYQAIMYMLSTNQFSERTFRLYQDERSVPVLIGQIHFSSSRRSIGGNGAIIRPPALTARDTNNDTSATSLSFPYRSGIVTGDFRLFGLQLDKTEVILTVYAAILQMATHAKSHRVTEFVAPEVSKVYLAAREPQGKSARTQPPFLTYEALLWAVGDIPEEMAGNDNNWREGTMSIKIDGIWVGTANFVYNGPRIGYGSPIDGNMTTA
ncbi:MAG: hypothetical protein Q9191_005280 [Dirinaria sp. TL-2023a]